MKFAICCLILTCFVLNGMAQVYNKGCITMKVVDEEGRAITNAKAGATFSTDKPRGEVGTKPFSIDGLTDTNGMFTAEAAGNPTVYYGAKKNGYYDTHNLSFMFTNAVLMRWQPWNPTVTVVLRKIVNPIPMYAKRVETIVPAFNAPFGYDLEKGDWVAPHGQGSVRDLVFEVDRRVKSQDDYEAILTVSSFRQVDGVQDATTLIPRGSALRLSAEVPFVGYHTNLVVKWGRNPAAGGTYGNVGDDYNPNYFFRVRSELDDKGNVVHALYGKVHGSFRVSGVLRDEARLSFTYYLNPASDDRNVEFDPSNNLFKNLKSSEEVREP